MLLSGQSPDGRLVEIVELKDHPWFVASQFHPEFKSRPERPHPLFDGFVSSGDRRPRRPRAGASRRAPSPNGRRPRADDRRWPPPVEALRPRPAQAARRRSAHARTLPDAPRQEPPDHEDLPRHRRHRRDPDRRPLGRARRRHHEPDALRQGRRLVRRHPRARSAGSPPVRCPPRSSPTTSTGMLDEGRALREARPEHRGQGRR